MKELIEILSLKQDSTSEDVVKAVQNIIAENELLTAELSKVSPKDGDIVKQIFIDNPHYKALYFDDKKIDFHTKEKTGFTNKVTREEALAEKKSKK